MMNTTVAKADGLAKAYGATKAVDGVSFELRRGQVTALVGRNGAGKTTLIKLLLGLEPATAGTAVVLELEPAGTAEEIRRQVGYVPENHQLYKWMTVAEILAFTSAFYPTWDSELADELLRTFALEPDKKLGELSRGMLAKVALTLALAHRPKLLILDEPTSGLDAIIRHEFLESIIDVAADEDRTVLISSHLLTDVERVTDDVLLMEEGRILFAEELTSLQDRVREIRLTFDEAPPADFSLPGALRERGKDRERLCVVGDFGGNTLTELEGRFPGAKFEARRLSLEEVFVALVAGKTGASPPDVGDAAKSREDVPR